MVCSRCEKIRAPFLDKRAPRSTLARQKRHFAYTIKKLRTLRNDRDGTCARIPLCTRLWRCSTATGVTPVAILNNCSLGRAPRARWIPRQIESRILYLWQKCFLFFFSRKRYRVSKEKYTYEREIGLLYWLQFNYWQIANRRNKFKSKKFKIFQ